MDIRYSEMYGYFSKQYGKLFQLVVVKVLCILCVNNGQQCNPQVGSVY